MLIWLIYTKMETILPTNPAAITLKNRQSHASSLVQSSYKHSALSSSVVRVWAGRTVLEQHTEITLAWECKGGD